ncbi:hypothetical protein BH23GEM10_BH23GEM10_12030 [soil metagenome]
MRNTIILAASLAFTAAACSNPVSPSDHPEAGGVVIMQAGTSTVLSTSVGSLTAFNLAITLAAGESLEVEVLFLDASNPSDLTKAFHPREEDGESLRAVVANSSIVEYHGHGDHGDFDAVAAGQTTVVFQLMHGSHADFVSGPLTVIVN